MTRTQHNDAIINEMRAYEKSDNINLRALALGIINRDNNCVPWRKLSLINDTYKKGSEEAEVTGAIMQKYNVPTYSELLEMEQAEREKSLERNRQKIEEKTQEIRDKLDEDRRKRQGANIVYLFVWILSFFLSLGLVTLKGGNKSSHISTRQFGNGRFQ